MSEIGRNELCPCGSGLKYKRCCLGKAGDLGRQGAFFEDGEELELGRGPGSGGPAPGGAVLGGVPYGDAPIGGQGRFRPPAERSDLPPMMAPSLAHAFAKMDRIAGRTLYEHGLVSELALVGHELSAWVEDHGHDYRGSIVFAPLEDGTAGIQPKCSCPSGQRVTLCRHLYAILLHRDALRLGDRVDKKADPHSFEEVLFARLEMADSWGECEPLRTKGLDPVAAQIVRSVEETAKTWGAGSDRYYGPMAGYDEEFAVPTDVEFQGSSPLDDPDARVDDWEEDWEEDWEDDWEDDDDDDEWEDLGEADPEGRAGTRVLGSPSQNKESIVLDSDQRLRNFELHLGPVIPHASVQEARLCYLLEPHGERVSLRLLWQTRKANGEWGARSALQSKMIGNLCLQGSDLAILVRLQGATLDNTMPSPYLRRGSARRNRELWEFDPAEQSEMEPPLASELVPLMIASGACYLVAGRSQNSSEFPPPLVMDEGERLRFVIRGEEKGPKARLVGELRRGQELMTLPWPWQGPNGEQKLDSGAEDGAEPPVILGRDHVVLGTTCHPLESLAEHMMARSLLARGPLEFAAADRDDFLRRFVQLPGSRHLEEGPFVGRLEQAMRPRLTLEDPTGSRKKYLEANIEFDYGEGHLERREGLRTHFWHEGRLHARDFEAEERFIDGLREQGVLLEAPQPKQPGSPAPDARLLRAGLDDRILDLIAAGWDVYAAGFPVRRSATPSLQVRSGRDWFEVEGGIDFDGFHVPLPELLKLRGKKKRQRLLRLGDGSFAIQASEWLERWLELIGLGEIHEGVLRLRSSQGWLLDVMLEEHEGSIQIDETFAKAREALRHHDRVEPHPTPQGFGTKLRHYQEEGLGWMLFLHDLGLSGCLADDMGLGKTVEVLALLEYLRQERQEKGASGGKPSLVVAPRSLLDNWEREAARFCPELKTLIWYGPGRFKVYKESFEAGFADVDLVLITYGTLRRDIPKFREIGFEYAILDEAQAIKNAQSQASKAARLLCADHRLALSGTPIENHLGEIWSLFDFLNPGMLGRSTTFKEICSASANAGAEGMAQLTKDISRALGPFFLRRTKEEVLPDLPSKTEQVLHIELPTQQRRMYDELRRFYQKSLLKDLKGEGSEGADLAGQQMHVLEALLRLRQAACHPGLIAPEHADSVSGKFESLLAMLDELLSQGHKALIFSQFTSLLELLKPHLDQREITFEYLDGKTRDRQQRVDRFQEDKDCSLFLISLKAGGVGLNLTAADYVFLLDPWWNPAVESQAIDRTHRIGQTKKVLAYRLIARNTVEEHVAALQAEKRELVDAVMAGSGGGLRGLKVEDLQRLLGDG